MARTIAVAVLVAALALYLTGCAATSLVPVPTPCIAAADVPPEPAYSTDKLPPDASDAELVRGAWVDYVTARNDSTTLRALIGACTQ